MKNKKRKIEVNGKVLYFEDITPDMMGEMKLEDYERDMVWEMMGGPTDELAIPLAQMTGTEFLTNKDDCNQSLWNAIEHSDYSDYEASEIILAVAIYYGRDIKKPNGEPAADISHKAKYLSFAFIAPILANYARLRRQLDTKIKNYLLQA